MDEPLTMSVPTAARRCGLGKTFMWSLALRGDLPTVVVGRRRLVREADLRRFLEDHLEGGKGNSPAGDQLPAALNGSQGRSGRRLSASPAPARA